MNNKSLFFKLACISALVLGHFLAWIFSLGVSEFDGGRGYTSVCLTPILFVGLLILFFIDYRIFYKPNSNYLKQRNIF